MIMVTNVATAANRTARAAIISKGALARGAALITTSIALRTAGAAARVATATRAAATTALPMAVIRAIGLQGKAGRLTTGAATIRARMIIAHVGKVASLMTRIIIPGAETGRKATRATTAPGARTTTMKTDGGAIGTSKTGAVMNTTINQYNF